MAAALVALDFKIFGMKIGTAGSLIILSSVAKLAVNLAYLLSYEQLKISPSDATEEDILAVANTLIYYRTEIIDTLSKEFKHRKDSIKGELLWKLVGILESHK